MRVMFTSRRLSSVRSDVGSILISHLSSSTLDCPTRNPDAHACLKPVCWFFDVIHHRATAQSQPTVRVSHFSTRTLVQSKTRFYTKHCQRYHFMVSHSLADAEFRCPSYWRDVLRWNSGIHQINRPAGSTWLGDCEAM